MRLSLKRLLILAALFSASVLAQPFQSYQVVGEGNMRWFIFSLYQARLLTPDGSYQQDAWPIALALTYQRDIAASDLVKTTESEWQRMKTKYSPGWLDRLVRIWPNVSKDDVLLLHIDAQGFSHFYYNGRFVGGLDDVAFSRAFLGIWLSTEARDQGLRKQLVGINRQPLPESKEQEGSKG